MDEIFKPIKDYERLYLISNLGRVLNIKFGRKRFLKFHKNKKGYLGCSLCKNNTKKTYTVHRLVAAAFIPNTENKSEINHIDTIKTNNIVSNLEWSTRKENAEHASLHELYPIGNKNSSVTHPEKLRRGPSHPNHLHPENLVRGELQHNSKLKEEDIVKIRLLHKQGMMQKNIAILFNMKQPQISAIILRKAWAHVKDS